MAISKDALLVNTILKCSAWRVSDIIKLCQDMLPASQEAELNQHINYCFSCQMNFLRYIDKPLIRVIAPNNAVNAILAARALNP